MIMIILHHFPSFSVFGALCVIGDLTGLDVNCLLAALVYLILPDVVGPFSDYDLQASELSPPLWASLARLRRR